MTSPQKSVALNSLTANQNYWFWLPEGENKVEDQIKCTPISTKLSQIANQMYDAAFEKATTGISEIEVGRLKNLSADRVRSWIPQS